MTVIANGARGEVVATIAGEPRKLCLTLGALAEIETAFELTDWKALGARLGQLSAKDLLVVLAALLRGGGESDAAARLAHLPVDLKEAAEAVASAFHAAVGD